MLLYLFLRFQAIVTITYTITITRTPLTTSTSISSTHELPLVIVSLLPVGQTVFIVLIVQDGDMVKLCHDCNCCSSHVMMTLFVNTSVTATDEQI